MRLPIVVVMQSGYQVKDMNDIEAIELRQSRRSYLTFPLEASTIEYFNTLIKEYNKQSGLSIQLIEDGKASFKGFSPAYGLFHGVQSYFAMVGKSSDPHLNEKIGYYGALLVLEATKLGLGTCFVAATYNRDRCKCKVEAGEELICLITVGHVNENKGFKERTIYKMVHRKSKSIEQLYTSEGTVPDWFIQGMKAVQKAPSAMNQQPVQFQYKENIVTANVADASGHLGIDLGIAKLFFEKAAQGKFEFGNDAPFSKM